jgi:exodeoxyribonuclease VII small subunit
MRQDARDESNGRTPAGPREDSRRLEEALRRLEEIAGVLERGTLDLESSLALYREACDLHAFCVARLAEVEREARILTEDGLETACLETEDRDK